MLKKIVISLSAVAFILSAGSLFAASLSSVGIINGESSKADVVSLFGEPGITSKDQSGNEKYIYEQDGTRLDVTFKNDVVWDSHEDSAN